MQPDKYKRQRKTPHADRRVRRQIAQEAARRMSKGREAVAEEGGSTSPTWLLAATESDFYTAKRKAVAVLGQKVRPGDLPSDDEIREEIRNILRNARPGLDTEFDDTDADDGSEGASGLESQTISGEGLVDDGQESLEDDPVPLGSIVDHLERFTVYRMWLVPLETVKQNPRLHPEGDALFHSLQAFELARAARPYDEEFLIAALLHDVGKGIDPQENRRYTIETLRNAVSLRTLWLVENLHEPNHARASREYEATPEDREDLALLRTIDQDARVPGASVPTLDEALDYLRGLESETYLDS